MCYIFKDIKYDILVCREGHEGHEGHAENWQMSAGPPHLQILLPPASVCTRSGPVFEKVATTNRYSCPQKWSGPAENLTLSKSMTLMLMDQLVKVTPRVIVKLLA